MQGLKQSTKDYLSAAIVPTLIDGLTKLAIARPDDPHLWMAQYILDSRPNAKAADLVISERSATTSIVKSEIRRTREGKTEEGGAADAGEAPAGSAVEAVVEAAGEPPEPRPAAAGIEGKVGAEAAAVGAAESAEAATADSLQLPLAGNVLSEGGV
jgi:hypothetical protein